MAAASAARSASSPAVVTAGRSSRTSPAGVTAHQPSAVRASRALIELIALISPRSARRSTSLPASRSALIAATTTPGSLVPVNSAVAFGPHWARPLRDSGAQRRRAAVVSAGPLMC